MAPLLPYQRRAGLVHLDGFCDRGFRVEGRASRVEESVQIAALDGNSYISGHIGGYSFMGTGGASGEIKEDDAYTVMVSDGNGGYEKRRYGSMR